MRLHRTLALSSVILATAAVPTTAQGVVTLVLEGDTIPGVGKVTVIDNLAINDSGDWVAEVRTDNTNTSMNQVTLKNGFVILAEGAALPNPTGATLSKFDSLTITSGGDVGTNLLLGGLTTSTDGGLYVNDKLVLQEGDVTTASGFSSGTVYKEFNEVRLNSVNQMLVVATMDDPIITSGTERAMMLLDLDANGNLIGETAILIAGASYNGPLISGPIADFGTNFHYFDFNNAGDGMYRLSLATGAGGLNEAIMLGSTIIAEETGQSPVLGRNWGSMGTPELGMNNNGEWVWVATLDGSTADNQLIVVNNTKLVQKADPVPGLPQWSLQSFGSGPVEIGDNGNVLWFGDWDDPNMSVDQGLFVGTTLMVQEGVTTVGSNVIKKLIGLIDGYHMSPSGNYMIFEGELDNGKAGVFQMALGGGSGGGEPGTGVCFGDGTSGGSCPCGNPGPAGAGCQNSSGGGGVLKANGSASIVVDNVSFQATSLPSNRIALLASGGTATTNLFGDGMLCIGSSWTGLGARISNGGGAASWGIGTLSGAGFTPGQTAYFQILFRDPSGPCSSAFGTSGAYMISFVQ